ncbi:MAG: hypothetical protein OEY34_09675, partial [Cyclobacteriaceae bacterium]|nr:hypothetical protein [Cyclobacteriaceae bacterium]
SRYYPVIKLGTERIIPPIFHLYQCQTNKAELCSQETKPFKITEIFHQPKFDYIRLAHLQEITEIKVLNHKNENPVITDLKNLFLVDNITRGYSNESFDDAFLSAVKMIKENDPNPFPDKLYNFKVHEQGSILGGIADLNHTFYVDVISN